MQDAMTYTICDEVRLEVALAAGGDEKERGPSVVILHAGIQGGAEDIHGWLQGTSARTKLHQSPSVHVQCMCTLCLFLSNAPVLCIASIAAHRMLAICTTLYQIKHTNRQLICRKTLENQWNGGWSRTMPGPHLSSVNWTCR